MSACLHLCNMPGPNSERICTLGDHGACREQRWGTLSGLESPGRAGEPRWDWSLLPCRGLDGGSRSLRPLTPADGGLVRSNLYFVTPGRCCGWAGGSERWHFPRKQKQIRLVIKPPDVWFRLASFSSCFFTDRLPTRAGNTVL